MSDSAKLVLFKVVAVGTACLMVVTLSAIAVVKADNKKPKEVATGQGAGSSSEVSNGTGGDQGTGAEPGAAQSTEGGSTTGGASTGSASGPGGSQAAGGTGAKATGAKSGPAAAAGGSGCPDYNPNVGVYCDHFLAGGTTVLSGPLAVY